jgi:hypothetical protein
MFIFFLLAASRLLIEQLLSSSLEIIFWLQSDKYQGERQYQQLGKDFHLG